MSNPTADDNCNLIFLNSSLDDALRSFILAREADGKATRTIEFYQDEIWHFVNYSHSHDVHQVEQISAEHIRLWLRQLGETRTTGGKHANWRAIRAWLNWYEVEYEPDTWVNPSRKIRLKAPDTRAIPGITMADFARLIAAARKTTLPLRDVAMWYALLDSCARAFEFLALNLDDVNFTTGDVLIRAGKGNKPRYVQFGPTTRKQIRQYLKTRNGLTPKSPLFVNRGDERLNYNRLYSILRWCSKKAGIETPGLHDIRRAGALELLRNGAALPDITTYLGHDDVEVTMRYLAINPDDVRRMHRIAGPVDHSLR